MKIYSFKNQCNLQISLSSMYTAEMSRERKQTHKTLMSNSVLTIQ